MSSILNADPIQVSSQRPVEPADLASSEVCAVGSRRARPYGMAS